MDEIADRVFQADDVSIAAGSSSTLQAFDESPSSLSLIIDINPLQWFRLKDQIDLKDLSRSICIYLNCHLSLNSSNKVNVLVANNFSDGEENGGSKILFPSIHTKTDEHGSSFGNSQGKNLVNPNMYRQFRFVDEIFLEELHSILQKEPTELNIKNFKNTLSGALSISLSYINKLNLSNDGLLKSRILIISVTDDDSLPYISTMNCIFAAQKMKVPIDVLKLDKKDGVNNSIFLQQATDATNGIFQKITHPKGLVQYLSTSFLIDSNLRSILILPTNFKIDFRSSCFLTKKIIDIGYVCSVCLCILSLIPKNHRCPVCDSKFDDKVIEKLLKKPVVGVSNTNGKKKRKINSVM
ncbi:hypothetical protein PACTADRAFT_184848 [Pachysolen tannophilus NRRL Y-2460]|uniref:General transcription and DNA repair factor IIH subunit TFB4 n=1 Tax=Pachysolen tannophilus NRRL Y-2460 TaxID=669874 RepID=A0A1E4U3J2_PACTA|nr:hypothetical protein PACTADRAFT_184848 [Pachysolen tannophilus NRRL Y-2460]